MPKIAVYPGTFDPITLGHVDLVKRASALFDKIIVAVAESANKKPFFTLEKRVAIAKQVFADFANVDVMPLQGLTVDFAQKNKAQYILRGLRNGSDLDFEFELAGMNKMMSPNLETVFLMPSPEVSAISATVVREIAAMGGDISSFVPEAAKRAFAER